MVVKKSKDRVSLVDRLAVAVGGIVFGAATLLGYVVVAFFLIRPGAAPGLIKLIVSPAGIIYVAVCGLVGAIAGPAKLAEFFSVLWGSHSFWQSPRGRWVAVVIAVIVVAALFLTSSTGRVAP